MTRITAFLALSTLILAPGCKKKEAETAPAAGAGNVLKGATLPEGDDAKAFATTLMTHKAVDIKPTDNGDMPFVYKTLAFSAENNGWLADAVLGQGADSIPCQEIGTWKIEEVKSPSTAVMTWSVNKTTCAGRAPQNTMRVEVTIKDGNYDVSMR